MHKLYGNTILLGVILFFGVSVSVVQAESELNRSCVDLTQNLKIGSVGSEVLALQNFLVQQGYLAEEAAAGYYGSYTAAAVGALQHDWQIIRLDETALSYGVVGLKTRLALACNSLEIKTMSTATAVAVSTTTNAEPRVLTQQLLTQPSISDVDDYFMVRSRPSEAGRFYLVQWQNNPFTTTGKNIPVQWRVGDKTGFYPANATTSQRGMNDVYGSTAVQAEDRTIGIYLNSADLINGSNLYKLGIFPAIQFSTDDPVYPFTLSQFVLRGSVALQVPTASSAALPGKSSAQIVHYFVFTDPKTGINISYAVGLFLHKQKIGSGGISFDTPTQSIIVANPLGGNSRVTKIETSESRQSEPWNGYKEFAYSISGDQFAEGLRAAAVAYPELGISTNPKDYYLKSSHINSEVLYKTAPAELGLSVRRFRVDLLKYEQS